jgi:putative peptidoglycan lipid II flippase
LAVFFFANNIQSAPLGLFGVSFAIAVFPTLSAYAARNEQKEFIRAFSRTLRQVLFFVIPLSVFLIVLRAQTVRVILGTGKFNWDNTIMTFQVLGLLTIGLFAQSLLPLLTRAFYALQNTKTPLKITIVSEAVLLLGAILLIKPYGIYGLAIAFSFYSIFNMMLLIIYLRKSLPNIDGKNIINSTLRITAASLVAGGVAQIMKYIVGTQGELDTFLAVFTQLVVAGSSGLAAFAIASYYFNVKEFFQFKASVTRKLFRAKKVITEDTGEVAGI